MKKGSDRCDGNDMQRTGESVREMAGAETETKKDQREGDREDGSRGRWSSPGGHTMCERMEGGSFFAFRVSGGFDELNIT